MFSLCSFWPSSMSEILMVSQHAWTKKQITNVWFFSENSILDRIHYPEPHLNFHKSCHNTKLWRQKDTKFQPWLRITKRIMVFPYISSSHWNRYYLNSCHLIQSYFDQIQFVLHLHIKNNPKCSNHFGTGLMKKLSVKVYKIYDIISKNTYKEWIALWR